MSKSAQDLAARRGAVVLVPLILVLSAGGFARYFHDFYPVEDWLFWRYLGYWLAISAWSLGCVSSGYALVRRMRGRPLPFAETIALSFPAGVVLFYLAMNVLGTVHALHPLSFYLLPLAMIASGARPLWRLCRRYVGLRRRARLGPWPSSWIEILAWVFGLLVLGMIYFKILTPENAAFDARWKHLALAEQYAHVGFIPRFAEGWTVATNPHMATMLYTWAFLVPGGVLFDQMELAAHMEFACLLWTLVAIPPALRLLVPGARAPAAWAARFLFPGVLLYDSCLSSGADHIAALFGLPIFILLLRSLPRLDPGRLGLLALMMVGAAMPKLTAGMMLVPGAVLAVAVRVVWKLAKERELHWRGPALATAVALLGTAFFWARNWYWYGDPLYPSLHEHLTLRPWTQDAAALFEWGYKDYQFWRPTHDWEGVKETLKALVDFSFVPNDYKRYHRDVPVFGSLFTLMLAPLLLLKDTKRIWLLVVMTHLGIFIWYWIHHQDRYLQTMVPWMSVVVAAGLVRIWRLGVAARVAAALLVITQIVIGGDVYFFNAHVMSKEPLKKVNDLLKAGHEKQYDKRLEIEAHWVRLREQLPEDAHVMLHDNHIHLGLSRRTASDWGGWQFGISYGRLGSPAEVYDLYREIGVTHIAWQPRLSKGWDSIAGDLVFFDFAMRHAVERKRVSRFEFSEMPPQRPSDEAWGKVAYLGCGKSYATGVYELAQLTVPVFGPDKDSFPAPLEAFEGEDAQLLAPDGAMLRDVDFVVVEPECHKSAANLIKRAGYLLGAGRKRINPRIKTDIQMYFVSVGIQAAKPVKPKKKKKKKRARSKPRK